MSDTAAAQLAANKLVATRLQSLTGNHVLILKCAMHLSKNSEGYAYDILETSTQNFIQNIMVALAKKRHSKYIANSVCLKFNQWKIDNGEHLTFEYEFGSRWGHSSRNAKKLFLDLAKKENSVILRFLRLPGIENQRQRSILSEVSTKETMTLLMIELGCYAFFWTFGKLYTGSIFNKHLTLYI